MLNFLLKVIPWIFWLATAWQYFTVFLSASAFLLTGQLNKPECQSVVVRFLMISLGLTLLSIIVHIVCRRLLRKNQNP